MEMSRNQMHFVIMTVIYNELTDYSFGSKETFRDAKELISLIGEQPYEEISDYVKVSVEKTLNNYGVIVNAFLPYLKNWTWERIPGLTKSILLMSYAHYYYVEKIDKKIVIDIAVELAKKYVDEKQARFVNAILDGVIK